MTRPVFALTGVRWLEGSFRIIGAKKPVQAHATASDQMTCFESRRTSSRILAAESTLPVRSRRMECC